MIPLLVRSHYSLLRGTASPAAICRAARAMGYERLALTDRDNLYGLWPFLRACRKEKILPIVGAEITEANSSRRAVCLVENDQGYRNLCLLLTARHTVPEFKLEREIGPRHSGLTLLTADPELLTLWRRQGVAAGALLAQQPTAASSSLRQLARKLGAPVVAVPDAFFLRPQDYRLHCLLRAIAGRTSLSRLQPETTAAATAWLAGPREYRQRFSIWPEALRQSRIIAGRCTFTGPEFGVVLPPYQELDPERTVARLREAAYQGARRRYGENPAPAVGQRLEHELEIIAGKGFAAYFLVVRDIVSMGRGRGRQEPGDQGATSQEPGPRRICGRGSGAASLVAYCLEITNVCPLKHNLYFERFLNPGRLDPPDIDVDFAWDERDELLTMVLARHQGHAAMVCNHVLFQPRMALRETARAFGLPEGEIKRRLAALSISLPHGETEAQFSALPQGTELKSGDSTEPWPEIMALAARLLGIPRYLSVHPGGVVITPRPLAEYVPVQYAVKGVPIIQWEKEGTEEAGLVKIDLLGNRSLGVIRDAIGNIRENRISFDERDWQPEEDEKTRQAVAQGRTMGCFYIESPAMRLLQRKAGVGDFENLVLQSSIIRPAANEYIREYIRRLHGGRWQAPPLLNEVLSETFGLMVYQEDVSRVAVALAGFSHAEADGLRKIVAKKDRRKQLRDYQEQFVAGARLRGLTETEIETIWRMIMSFSGYSFCKPHSASYAKVSFQAAYLKSHFPAEFMAAVISNQGGFYSTFAYVSEARRLGLRLLPVDVNQSGICWQGRGQDLRVGLMAIKNLTEKSCARLLRQRRQEPFQGSMDFFIRVRPEEEEGRGLILAGGLDALEPQVNRAGLLWQFAHWQRQRKDVHGMNLIGGRQTIAPPSLPPEEEIERLRREYAVLGFLYDRHPLTLVRPKAGRGNLVKAADFPRFLGRSIRFAGWLITGKIVSAGSGEAMEFITFEDETGLAETTIFPAVFRQCRHLLRSGRPYLITGRPEEENGVITLTVERLELL